MWLMRRSAACLLLGVIVSNTSTPDRTQPAVGAATADRHGNGRTLPIFDHQLLVPASLGYEIPFIFKPLFAFWLEPGARKQGIRCWQSKKKMSVKPLR